MKRLPILVDMDGVFADFVGAVYTILEQRLGPEAAAKLPDPDKLTTFYLEDAIEDRVISREVERIVDDEPSLFGIIKPFPGAIEGMQLLRKRAMERYSMDVFICTAPHKQNISCYTQKAQWIEKHLGFSWLNNTMIVRDKTLVKGCVLLDDKPNPLGEYTPTWEHVVFARHYNISDAACRSKPFMKDWSPVAVDELIYTAHESNLKLECAGRY